MYDGVRVAGTQYRLESALDFLEDYAEGRPVALDLRPEPENEHDEHAVRVFGRSPCGERLLGYVPRPLAETIAYRGMQDLRAELVTADIDNEGRVVIEMRVIGED